MFTILSCLLIACIIIIIAALIFFKKTRTAIGVFTGLIILAVAAVIIFFNTMIPHSGKYMHEKQMQEYFIKHYDAYENLRKEIEILEAKGLVRVDEDWTNPEDYAKTGVTKAEVENLRKKMKALNAVRGYAFDNDGFELITYSYGLVAGGTTQGYYYSEKAPEKFTREYNESKGGEDDEYGLVDSIEKYTKDWKGTYTLYMKITGNWYVFEEFSD